MFDTFKNYLYAVIHPFAVHEMLAKEDIGSQEAVDGVRISMSESILISWIFSIFKGILDLLQLSVAASTVNYMLPKGMPLDGIFSQFQTNFASWYLVAAIFIEVILFPVITYFFIEVERFIIGFYLKFIQIEEDNDKVIDDIIVVSLSSNIVKFVPFVGGFLHQALSWFLFYVGFRKRLKQGRVASALLVLAPTALVIFVVISVLLFIGLMFKKGMS